MPHQWLDDSRSKKAFSPTSDTVKLMTMHSSKGLEFPLVVVAGLGHLPVTGADPTAEARLLYVAMTRSTERLLLTGHGNGAFLKRLHRFFSTDNTIPPTDEPLPEETTPLPT